MSSSSLSSTELPTVTSGWELHGTSRGGDGSEALVWNDSLPLPAIGPTDVLVRLHAWAINYPDISIANGTFPWSYPEDGETKVPGTDGAGEVIAVGSHVQELQRHDRVVVVYYPKFLHGAAPTLDQMQQDLRTFRRHAVLPAQALIRMPANLTYAEAATLPCSALTAWNALHGLTPLKAGDAVLTQGTGGVALFAVRFALAAGATVIATTSSDDKACRLREMGVQHVLNYREDPEWGESARRLTREGLGCQRVIEVGGPQTIAQSFRCVARGGEIDVIGFLGGQDGNGGPSFLEPLLRACVVRGIEVGNRIQFEEMNRAIEAFDLRPVVDERVFGFGELREAYAHVWNRRMFGKVVLADQVEE
ncbi:zinc-dependent alcohol dehydrogenase family protein [Aspergillus aculeatinus CBS 121060]|uniref:Zinc-binding dehydrogenase n=1 Tax=Aspergillus aculeatinus CBS 121060 TaxID=1448322 RepID=A0ACD1H8R8_9EURO|nr:zinc-binding dehydrogenase [Aspergillus aculeatinus CBS 121060]RAH69977.1 zinc-binding dehydrogenase [Aspergillus aculeatinus CBS 121060]